MSDYLDLVAVWGIANVSWLIILIFGAWLWRSGRRAVLTRINTSKN